MERSKMSEKLLLLLAISLIQLPVPLKADYQLEVQVESYQNPSHNLFDGSDCDFGLFNTNECDTHLKFCFRPPGFSSSEIGGVECPLSEFTSGRVGGDDITFTDLVGGLSNPFFVPVTGSWLGSFQLIVEVYDADRINNDDFVDVIFASPYNLSVGSTITQSYPGRRAQIQFTFRVLCASNFYGSTCSTFCEDSDSDEAGHYICNPPSGEKECRPGFTNTTTNCITAVTDTPPPVVTTTVAAVTTTQGGGRSPTTPATTTTTPVTLATDATRMEGSSQTGATQSDATISPSTSASDVTGLAGANRGRNTSNVGAIVGPILAVVVLLAAVITVLVVFFLWKRNRKFSSEDDLSARMLEPQTSINDGIPNAAYDPVALGVVYSTEKDHGGDKTFENPLYHSASTTYSSPDSTAHRGNGTQGGGDTMSSSGLYSTIDNRSPRRSWAPRPPQS